MVASRFSIGIVRLAIAFAAAALVGGASASAEVIGAWDFSTGSLTPTSGIPGVQLNWLPDTPYYAAFGGTPNPPALAYGTTSSFGVSSLSTGDATVLRVPDMGGRGPAVGMMATFPFLSNGTAQGGGPATYLNRYSFVTDVLVPASSFATSPTYLDLFQTRGNTDGALFIRKPTQELGAAVSYGNPIFADTWYRIALVMQLDAATSAPRYNAYVNGQVYAEIIWDNIIVDSNRNADLKDFDLVPDGTWSVAALSETDGSLPSNVSAFFAFNDNNGEVGELYVANMLFRDDALTPFEVAALGGPAPGLITPVPEPSSIGLLVTAGIAAASGLRGRRRRQAAAR